MLAREGAVVLLDEAADGQADRLEAIDAVGRLQVEQRPHVHAAGRGMAGERGAGAVPGHDLLEVVDEVGQPLDGHGGVLDERGRPLHPGRAHEQRQRGAAELPRLGHLCRVGERQREGRAELGLEAAQPRQAGLRLVDAPLVLDQQHAGVVAIEDGGQPREPAQVRRAAQRRQVDQLDRRRPGAQDGEVGLQRRTQAGEGQRRQRPRLGDLVELHREAGEQRQRALRAGQQAGQVGLGLQQLGQVVAGDAAAGLGKVGGDAVARARPHRREPGGQPPPARPLDPRGQVVAARRPEGRGLPAGEDAVHAQQLVLGLAVDDRARARRVVAGHAADRGLVDGRRVRPELEAPRRRRAVERRLDHARVDDRCASVGVDAHDAVEVEAVDGDARPEGLPSQARGGAAHAERHAVVAGHHGRGGKVVDRRGDQHRVGHDAVDRRVGRVQPAGQRRRRDRAGDVARQLARGGESLAGGLGQDGGAHAASICGGGNGRDSVGRAGRNSVAPTARKA